MRLENAFAVPAPVDDVWALLDDVPRVIPLMPGAQLAEAVDSDTFKALMHVKLGPMSLHFASDVRRERVEADERRVRLSVTAQEVKGRGRATATVESKVSGDAGGTNVTIVTDLMLQGAVAQYGRGIVADVAAELTARFADALSTELSKATQLSSNGDAGPKAAEAKPISGLRLALGVLWRSLLRRIRLT
jgi:carbon monoxide dehydrogenase subunit G